MAHAIDFMVFVRPCKELVQPATAWRQICAILLTAHENCRYLHLRHCVQNLLLHGVVQEPRCRLPAVTIVVDHRIGELCIVEALRKLDTENLPPASLGVREPSLDDVFLLLTGHHAEDKTEEAPPEPVKARGAR